MARTAAEREGTAGRAGALSQRRIWLIFAVEPRGAPAPACRAPLRLHPRLRRLAAAGLPDRRGDRRPRLCPDLVAAGSAAAGHQPGDRPRADVCDADDAHVAGGDCAGAERAGQPGEPAPGLRAHCRPRRARARPAILLAAVPDRPGRAGQAGEPERAAAGPGHRAHPRPRPAHSGRACRRRPCAERRPGRAARPHAQRSASARPPGRGAARGARRPAQGWSPEEQAERAELLGRLARGLLRDDPGDRTLAAATHAPDARRC
jgi:hypothetical protein